VNLSHKLRRWLGAMMALGLIAAFVSACGSSGGSSGTGTGSGSTSTPAQPSTVSGISQTGVGLTEPTTGSGAKIKGGTLTFAEAPGSPPNYIFPLYAPQYCGTNNIDDLDMLLYRPLYWYGNNYSPTVNYSDSIGKKPVYTNGNKTVTVHLNNYKWSNGEPVSARDLVFWMNVLEASPATEWCGFVPGKTFFPGNVVSYKAVNPTTFQMTFNHAYNPTWVQYNVLSQLTPIPLAWDKTSASGATPSQTATNAPDMTKSGAAKVYAYLNTQGQKLADWASSPLWSVVDGPWKLSATTTNGGVTFVPNTKYSGPTKPSVSEFQEIPFTSESSLVDQIKSEGPKGLSVAYLPAQDQPLTGQMKSLGYDVNMAAYYGINFFPLNFNNPTVGPIFKQLYFRQAFQHLVDQDGWISSFLHGTGVQTYGPVPLAPPSKLVSAGSSGNPYVFSVADAAKLLKDNGWKVVPGGSTTCMKAGTAAGDCGAGIRKGEAITFGLDYLSDVQATSEEMEDLQSQASKVGIKLTLTTHPFDDVYAAAVHCSPNEAKCKWTAENWGAGWIYGPDYYPTGEDLFQTGAVANYSNYSDPEMNKLVKDSIVASQSQEAGAMAKFVNYAETQLPVVFEPTSIGTFGASAGTLISNKIGGYAANALGWLSPEDWYLTK
jgi:peptide/nickel transport system substrate-binding protein